MNSGPSGTFFLFFHTLILSSFWTSRGHRCRPFSFPPGSRLQFIIAHRVQQTHCSSILRRVLLTHALALSASQIVHNKKSPRSYTSMHSGGFELTKLTYTRLEDNLIRHRGDRLLYHAGYKTRPDIFRVVQYHTGKHSKPRWIPGCVIPYP